MTARSVLLTILNLISAFIGLVIGAHIIFLLLGFNSSAPIIAWINGASNTLLAPFNGLLPNITLAGNSVLDLTAVLGLIVYAIIMSVLNRLISSLTSSEHYGDVHSHV